jgi:septal ring factor EnvC (AmiA/AmiB activator)
MMFVFSAKNVNQMYRRSRFMKEYATYQKAQGEAVKVKQAQITAKQQEIESNRQEKNIKLREGQTEQQNLERKQAEQKQMVVKLQKEQRTVQELIKKEQKQEAELNAKIEKLIAEEIAREKARIEAEKKRKAEELARKERERKEREKRLAEARAKEEAAKAQARAAKTEREKAEAAQRAKAAEKDRVTAERHVEETKKEIDSFVNADPDKKLTGNFASNKGKLPMPITGPYQVVRGFGSNVVEGLGNVHLSSKGLHLKGQPGAMARCVFDGEVSKIFYSGSSYVVMVRHGDYISVYCNLRNVHVRKGQRVSTRQSLGTVGQDNILQFQLRKETAKLNPEQWLGR